MPILKTAQDKHDELEKEFLRALDCFYDSWYRKAKVMLDRNDDPAEFVQTLMKDYALGNLETLPGLHSPLQCPGCGSVPDELAWLDYEEEHWIDDGGQEFVKQGGVCNCSKLGKKVVTYFMLPIEMEDL